MVQWTDGHSVAMSSDGSIMAVGVYSNDGHGGNGNHVRVFKYNRSGWDQNGADLDGEAAGNGCKRVWPSYPMGL